MELYSTSSAQQSHAYVSKAILVLNLVNGTHLHAMIVMVAATLIPISADCAVGQVDGNAELHKSDTSKIDENG